MRSAVTAAAALGLVLCCGAADAQPKPAPPAATAGPAVDPDAREALRKMSAYLGTLTSFEMTARTSLDLVTVDGQKLTFEGVTRYKARRPDGLVIDLTSDLKKRRYIYDGKAFTVYAPELGFYASVAAPPTIRQTLQTLHDKFGIDLPLDDLFRWADDGLKNDRLTSGIDVGPATVDGAPAEQYAFREGDIDWQVWIADGDKPLPLKVMIVDRRDPAAPAYTARLAWTPNAPVSAADFAFTPPKDSKSIRLGLVTK